MNGNVNLDGSHGNLLDLSDGGGVLNYNSYGSGGAELVGLNAKLNVLICVSYVCVLMCYFDVYRIKNYQSQAIGRKPSISIGLISSHQLMVCYFLLEIRKTLLNFVSLQ